jgi:hypothetical protein
MRMTRPPARSFTFEIKRASRRKPEALTLRENSSPHGSSFADQVFGKLSAQPRAALPGKIEVPASVCSTPALSTNLPQVSSTRVPSTEQSARRVLPDLLTVPANPVEERVQREAEERVARRRAPRTCRAKGVEHSSVTAAHGTMAPSLVTTIVGVSTEAVNVDSSSPAAIITVPQKTTRPVQQVGPSRKRKRNVLTALTKKAERNGRPLPHLPAGQRWKRRLPKTCW